MILELAVVILSLALIILTFLLFRQKQQKAIKAVKENQHEPTLQEQQLTSLTSQLVNSHQEI